MSYDERAEREIMGWVFTATYRESNEVWDQLEQAPCYQRFLKWDYQMRHGTFWMHDPSGSRSFEVTVNGLLAERTAVLIALRGILKAMELT